MKCSSYLFNPMVYYLTMANRPPTKEENGRTVETFQKRVLLVGPVYAEVTRERIVTETNCTRFNQLAEGIETPLLNKRATRDMFVRTLAGNGDRVKTIVVIETEERVNGQVQTIDINAGDYVSINTVDGSVNGVYAQRGRIRIEDLK